MVINKRGQFFLLAAVIISAIVMSFAFTANQARTNQEPEYFKDLTYEVKREMGEVIDYEIYTGFSSGDNLSDFVDKRSKDLEDKYPDTDFVFLYGDNESFFLKNSGTRPVTSDNQQIPGSNTPVISKIRIGRVSKETSATQEDLSGEEDTNLLKDNQETVNSVTVEIDGYDYEFPISSNLQVIFIVKKEVGDDRYVSVE